MCTNKENWKGFITLHCYLRKKHFDQMKYIAYVVNIQFSLLNHVGNLCDPWREHRGGELRLRRPRISWEIGWWGGRGEGVTVHPFLHQASGNIYKDDVNGLSSTLDICFMIKHPLGEAPIGKNWVKKGSSSIASMQIERNRDIFSIAGWHIQYILLMHS
jgi:hypothetical protein